MNWNNLKVTEAVALFGSDCQRHHRKDHIVFLSSLLSYLSASTDIDDLLTKLKAINHDASHSGMGQGPETLWSTGE